MVALVAFKQRFAGRAILLAALVVLVLPSTQSFAADVYYRWVDARGDTVHSDRPPPAGTDYETTSSGTGLVRSESSPQSAGTPIKKTEADTNPDVTYTREAPNTKNPEHCQAATTNLATLNTKARIRMRDDEGKYFYLTEEQKAASRLKAEKSIAAYCE